MIIGAVAYWLKLAAWKYKSKKLAKKYNLSPSVNLGEVLIYGKNITIGEHTYMNGGYLQAGKMNSIHIGKWCAIGYNVSIIAETHSIYFPTGPESVRPMKSADVEIGDGVWIGTNVVILPGVKIGNYAVIGANSVVRKDVPERGVLTFNSDATIMFVKNNEKCNEHISRITSN